MGLKYIAQVVTVKDSTKQGSWGSNRNPLSEGFEVNAMQWREEAHKNPLTQHKAFKHSFHCGNMEDVEPSLSIKSVKTSYKPRCGIFPPGFALEKFNYNARV